MALENLFIRTKRSIGSIQLDAIISESHSNPIRITKNPVELGADISDHAVIDPKKLNINAIVSDTPLGFAAAIEIVDTITGLFGSSTSENMTRSTAAYNALVALSEAREPISVQTGLKLYEDMLITNITVTQDVDTSKMVDLNISLEEIIITESQIVDITSDQLQEGAPRSQASEPTKRGRQEPTTPGETVNTSVLKTVIDWVF